jgi:hypothetical protein
MEYLLENPPLEIQKVGRWWDNEVGMNVLEDLQRKAAFIHHEGKKLYFAIFAKKGFTVELEQKAANEKNIFLYDFSGSGL